jgi:diguanylate cyclase (GGDEF)-like protein
MIDTPSFLKAILDTVKEHIVVIDKDGYIVYVNRSWIKFGQNNDCDITVSWEGINYLDAYDTNNIDNDAKSATDGIKKVIAKELDTFYYEYPCHSPTEPRWFMMRVTPLSWQSDTYYIIAHQNITNRKLAEQKVLELSRLDSLTNIPNRRTFDEALESHWSKAIRYGIPISLAIIDIDYFKLINDTYGHQKGDECLIKLASLLKNYNNNSNNIVARYGGEEFVVLLADCDNKDALSIVESIQNDIKELNIENKKSTVQKYMTASVGLATMIPTRSISSKELIAKADNFLYIAKINGRDQIVSNIE